MGVGATTLAGLGTAATVIGTGISVYGAVQQGQAKQDAANYQAAVDKNNATIAGYNADVAEQNQEQKTQAIERAGTLRLGAQRAALGASGVGIDSGSGIDIQSATTEDTSRAASTSQYQGELTGYGFRTQQQNFTDQATMSTASGANAAAGTSARAGRFWPTLGRWRTSGFNGRPAGMARRIAAGPAREARLPQGPGRRSRSGLPRQNKLAGHLYARPACISHRSCAMRSRYSAA